MVTEREEQVGLVENNVFDAVASRLIALFQNRKKTCRCADDNVATV